MPDIPFTTASFATAVPTMGNVTVSWTQLARAAATVGVAPLSLGGQPRPLVEMQWRTLMVRANVESSPGALNWSRSTAYGRLDPSEKSAVSYFLGMVQAKVMCQALLGITRLVHLDAVSSVLGISTGRSRPDFLGFDPYTGQYSFVLEAKGRTHGFKSSVAASAKTQTQRVSTASASSTRVASVAYFVDDVWRSHLEDPDNPKATVDGARTRQLLDPLYYWPLVGAMVRAGQVDSGLDDDRLSAYIPEADLQLSTPRPIFELLAPFVDGPPTRQTAESIGADLAPALAPYDRAPELPEDPYGKSVGLTADGSGASDGVQVELGPSWPSVGVQT